MKTVSIAFMLVFLQTVLLLAQVPPGLPANPSQAPLDGGLAAAALAGGAWAWRKLKRR